jgi:hypothetical protein
MGHPALRKICFPDSNKKEYNAENANLFATAQNQKNQIRKGE